MGKKSFEIVEDFRHYRSMLYAFFWVVLRRLNFICRRFGTLCLLHLLRQVGACKHTTFRTRRKFEIKNHRSNLPNEISVYEHIKSRLKLESVCCHSVQNFSCSSLPRKNMKVKIYITIILPVAFYECEI